MAEHPGRGGVVPQLFCLVLDVVSTLFSSAFQSLRLLVPARKNSSSDSRSESFSLYQGRVWHQRRQPIAHTFEYNARYALIDLARVPDWFEAKHHLSLDEARNVANTKGPVHLLYEQNPLSVYYCYDTDGSLIKCIAEVTNTPWAERVTFVFEPGLDMVPKPLHVSPFMDMEGTWRIRATQPGEELQILIDVQHPELGNYFSAVLKAKRTDHRNPEQFFWLMPHKVAIWIYWHAVLLITNGARFLGHPKYSDGESYRHVAIERDKQLKENSSIECKERYCRWREAPCWPWK